MAVAEGSDFKVTLGHGAVMVAVVLAIVLGWRWLNRDVDFCQAAFRDLARGRASAERYVAWEQLNALGVDIGQEYTAFPNDKERADYRQAFVRFFSKGFGSSGGSVSAFVNWRVVNRQEDTVTVAADYASKGKTLLFVIPSAGRKQLIGLRWDGPAQPCDTCGV